MTYQPSPQDIMLTVNVFANHTNARVDMCTKHGISHYHMLISHLSQQEVEGKAVAASQQATGAPITLLCIIKDTRRHFLTL